MTGARLSALYLAVGLGAVLVLCLAVGDRLGGAGVLAGFAVMTVSVALICGGGWVLLQVSGGALEPSPVDGEMKVPRYLRLAFLPLFLGKTLIGGAAVYLALAVYSVGLVDFSAGMVIGLGAFFTAVLVERSRFFLLPNTQN